MKDNEKEVQKLIKNQQGGIFCLNKVDFNKVMNYFDNNKKEENIINQFKKLKDKRKKAEAKLIKANNELKNFALKYGIENYLK